MEHSGEPPVGGISGREAAEILGLTNELSVSRLVRRGALPKTQRRQKSGLDRADVEQLALERYAHRDHPYWTTTSGAAEMLGVTRTASGNSSTADLWRTRRATRLVHDRWADRTRGSGSRGAAPEAV